MNDEFVDKKGIRWNPKEMLNDLWQRLETAKAFHKVAIEERDFERNLCDRYKKELYELRSLYEGVLSRINKLEDETRAAIEFNEDVLHDDTATLMILEFCKDIAKLTGEDK